MPFFPNEHPIEGLLARWLASKNQPTWPAELVDMVNQELRDELGGPDLQVGPSYFMKDGLDEEQVKRIWTYSVFPLIEDTLFGNRERIEEYRFDKVLARFKASAAVAETKELEAAEQLEAQEPEG
jgi:5-methylcytosine-specific restriction protein B